MTKTYCVGLILIIHTFCTLALRGQENFYAYHTKVVHSATDYMGKFADLIVVLGEDSRLEFTRRTQYLPKWVTPQGTFLVDDFYPGRDPDHEFNYNYIRLIEASDQRIVVHWRYIPDIETIEEANASLNPTFIGGFTAAVHELFIIYPSGRVEREVKDARGSNFANWNQATFADRQDIFLEHNGINHGRVKWGDKSQSSTTMIVGNPIIHNEELVSPSLLWTFDEGAGIYPEAMKDEILEILSYDAQSIIGNTFEGVNHTMHAVSGHGALYKEGVSGTSLGFDGYYTGVKAPRISADFGTTYFHENGLPEFTEALTLESWIALDAYPYNVAPIVHQSKQFGLSGFYFGIDPYGHLIFIVNGRSHVSEDPIQLYRWTHVAGVYGKGRIQLYVDGVSQGYTEASGHVGKIDADLVIGLNTERERCTDYVRGPMQNIPFIYGIQGLIDEVRVYDQVLSEQILDKHYRHFRPEDLTSPLRKAVLPGENGFADEFGASYKNLKHHELWDRMWRLSDHTDIVVKFDSNPASVVYWHGTNFAANWVTDNNRWMADQSSEIFTRHGCSEHMADKQTRHSYARIIESNEARVVIHWRYPNVDVGYVCTDRRNWTDEYHTIYPDGTGVRKVEYNNSNPPGFQDIQFFTNPGETALDVVNMNAMTVANTTGEILELVWEKPNKNPEQTLQDATIEWLNSKSKWKVFTIFQGPGISTWGSAEQSGYTDDPFAGPWNHWPVSLVPSDGRYAVSHDRVTHFALGANDSAPDHGSMVHYGFTDQKIDHIIPKARFWQNPPPISSEGRGVEVTFVKAEKAYLIDSRTSDRIALTINASKQAPLINPAFLLAGISPDKIQIKLNGRHLERNNGLRVGKRYDTNGRVMSIVWMQMESDTGTHLEFFQ